MDRSLDLVHELKVLVLLVRDHVHMDLVDVLIEHVRREDSTQPGRQSLVSLQLRLDLLGGEDGAAVAEGHDVAGVEHLGVPARQHLEPVLLYQHLPGNKTDVLFPELKNEFSFLYFTDNLSS